MRRLLLNLLVSMLTFVIGIAASALPNIFTSSGKNTGVSRVTFTVETAELASVPTTTACRCSNEPGNPVESGTLKAPISAGVLNGKAISLPRACVSCRRKGCASVRHSAGASHNRRARLHHVCTRRRRASAFASGGGAGGMASLLFTDQTFRPARESHRRHHLQFRTSLSSFRSACSSSALAQARGRRMGSSSFNSSRAHPCQCACPHPCDAAASPSGGPGSARCSNCDGKKLLETGAPSQRE